MNRQSRMFGQAKQSTIFFSFNRCSFWCSYRFQASTYVRIEFHYMEFYLWKTTLPNSPFLPHTFTQTPFFNGKIRKICTTQARMQHQEKYRVAICLWVVAVVVVVEGDCHTRLFISLCGCPSCTTFLSHMSAHALASLFIKYTHATSAAYNGHKNTYSSIRYQPTLRRSCRAPIRILGWGGKGLVGPPHSRQQHTCMKIKI